MQTDFSTTLDESTKVPEGMRESLKEIRNCIECTICNNMLREPRTLACACSFCETCIDTYCCNAWECPNCGQPVALKGERGGSYRKVNPSLETCITSWMNICKALESAPENWWKESGEEQSITALEQIEEESSDEEFETGPMIDLQADSPPKNACTDEDDDTFATARSE